MLSGSILQQLYDAHQSGQGSKRPLSLGVYYKNTLVALCHALEDAILTADYQPLMITAFQRGKWYLEEADRYGDIAERSRQIVILAAPDAGFAEHPTSKRDNVALVSLNPEDPVAQEWHLIIVSPRYTAMVLCQELSEADYGAHQPQEDRERKFYGMWTFDPHLVLETAKLAIAHIQLYNAALQAALTQQLADIIQQAEQQHIVYELPTADNLGAIVELVVDYLQTGQHDLQSTAHAYEFLSPKRLDSNLLSNELQAFLQVAQLIDQTDLSNPMAAAEVATLAESLGQLLDLPAWQLNRLRLAGLLHRIAFLQSVETGIAPGTSTRYEETALTVPLTCPLVPGTQMLRRMSRMQAIATILTHQTEHWDGSGQPAGLSGDEIPLESRILGLVAQFQHHLAKHRPTQNDPDAQRSSANLDQALTQALTLCKQQEGQHWDPKLVEALTLLVNGMKRGLNLPATLPKVASGLWLLDNYQDDLLRQVSVQPTHSS